jgi:hypothetical protein
VITGWQPRAFKAGMDGRGIKTSDFGRLHGADR